MQIYQDVNNDSGVAKYEIGSDRISVLFKGGTEPYVWTYASAGEGHIEQMKLLAETGNGLNSYIMMKVKTTYEIKGS